MKYYYIIYWVVQMLFRIFKKKIQKEYSFKFKASLIKLITKLTYKIIIY